MNWYKKATESLWWDSPEEEAAWKEELKRKREERERRGSAVKEEVVLVNTVPLTLYSGFYDLESMANDDGTYTMEPEGREQGLIWFAHSLFGRRFMHYADRGDYLLKYPIEVEVYKNRTWYEDGSFEDKHVESEGTENSQMYGGYKLPEGFIFSYKMQKFIGSTKPLTFTKDMVVSRSEEDDFDELV
jgi:hypothetical protein